MRPERFAGQLIGSDLKQQRLQDLDVERKYFVVAVELRDTGGFVDGDAESIGRHMREHKEGIVSP